MLFSLTMLSFRMRLPAHAAIFTMCYFMVDYTITRMTPLLPLLITSPLHNNHDGVNIGEI